MASITERMAAAVPAGPRVAPMPEYRVSVSLMSVLRQAESTIAGLRGIADNVVKSGVVKEVHKDVHPWIEYDLPCDQYAQMMVRFDVFVSAQNMLKQLLTVYSALPGWSMPATTRAQWESFSRPTGVAALEAIVVLNQQRQEYQFDASQYPDIQAGAVHAKQRTILFRAWHDYVSQLVELALWATNIQPIFMFPGEAQKQPNPGQGWFSSGLGVPKPVRDLLDIECRSRGGNFTYWQDNPAAFSREIPDAERKRLYYESFHTSTHSWFPGHPASAAIFAPFRRGVDVLKLVRGQRDGMVWEAAHWDELDRYQNLNHRAFPVHAYEAWKGPESLRPGQVVRWIGAYPVFMLDYVREHVQKAAPIPWYDGDHPLDGENVTMYTPHLSRLVIPRASSQEALLAEEEPPTSKRKRRRRRFRRILHWIFSPATAMTRTIVENRQQDEPKKSIVAALEHIDGVPDDVLEDLYWTTCSVDGDMLDQEWFEAWEDPRKYHLGARLRDVQQEIRRANDLVPVTTMGPRMRLKWAKAWAEGVAYQDAVQTFREGMNLFFDGHIAFFEARGELELDAAARQALVVAKAQANGQKVTQAIGAVAALAAAINPIAGAIVAVVAALVGLFTSLFGGSVRADNFRLAPQSPALRQPRDPSACAPVEAHVEAVAPPPESKLGLYLAAAAAGVLGYAIWKKQK